MMCSGNGGGNVDRLEQGVAATTTTTTTPKRMRQRIGAAYGDEDLDDDDDNSATSAVMASSSSRSHRRPRIRRRCHSMPMPKLAAKEKIESSKESDKENNARKSEDEELLLAKESAHIARASSLGKRRKKSIIGSGLQEVSKLRNFKTFVESKILSKSDRCLDDSSAIAVVRGHAGEELPLISSASTSEVKAGGGGGGLSAKDKFKRRSSRTSFSDFDPSSVRPKKSGKVNILLPLPPPPPFVHILVHN